MVLTFILIGIIALITIFDQIVKWVVALNLSPAWPATVDVAVDSKAEAVEVIEGFFRFTHLKNPGMSFGLFGGEGQRWIFMIVSPIALAAIAVYLFKFSKDKLPMKLGLAFILGGGFSNMIDRTFYGISFFDNPWTIFEESFWKELFQGYVIDMLDFYGIWDAVFNVADSFVCIGAGIVVCSLLYDIITDKSKSKKQANQKALELNEKMSGGEGGIPLPENEDVQGIKIHIDSSAKEDVPIASDITLISNEQSTEDGDKK